MVGSIMAASGIACSSTLVDSMTGVGEICQKKKYYNANAVLTGDFIECGQMQRNSGQVRSALLSIYATMLRCQAANLGRLGAKPVSSWSFGWVFLKLGNPAMLGSKLKMNVIKDKEG